MAVNPYTALVGWPVVVAKFSTGSANHARYASECPSSSSSLSVTLESYDCVPVPGGFRGSRRAPVRHVTVRRRQTPFGENAKIVVELKVSFGPSTVDGKLGWLGESGKCWV